MESDGSVTVKGVAESYIPLVSDFTHVCDFCMEQACMCAALLSSFVFLSGYCETSQGNHILLVGLSVCVQQLALYLKRQTKRKEE